MALRYPNTLVPNPADNGQTLLVHASASTHQHGYVPAAAEQWSSLLTFRLRRDGFVFARANGSATDGTLVSKALMWHGGELYMNANCTGTSAIRIGILHSTTGPELPGYGIADSVPFCGDSPGLEFMQWASGKQMSALAGQTLSLNVSLNGAGARLYAIRGNFSVVSTT